MKNNDFNRTQRGFAMIAAIVLLVMLTALGAAVLRLTYTQQIGSAQDIMGARAMQAANAGVEWGMYRAIKGTWAGTACNTSTPTQTLDLIALTGFKVTVTCSTQSTAYKEGQKEQPDTSIVDITLQLYVIDAVACNGSAASCPDDLSSGSSTYVERRRQSVVSSIVPGM
ncbi:MAG: MSHA biogenesis protein MshP [Aquabacterium sp.]|nr:MSHA biogenesis protein MshP [Aquabacterium sp.]